MKLTKIRPRRWGVAVLVGGILVLGGCTAPATDKPTAASRTDKTGTAIISPAAAAAAQQALQFYHTVTLDETRAQVETTLGVAGEIQPDGQVGYRNPDSGYGVLITYTQDDTVFAKRLLSTALAPELAALNPFPVTDKQAYRMAAGMPFYEVQDVMGSDGIEISLSRPEPCSPKQVTGLGWFNPDGSYAVVYLNLPTGEVIRSEFVPGSQPD